MSRFPPWDQSDEKKAWNEGFDDGWSSGWEQGLRLTMNEVFRRMIRDDVPMAYIMEYTSLSDMYLTEEFKEIMENEGRVIKIKYDHKK
jgi:hypothetical protein